MGNIGSITYKDLSNDLGCRSAAELAMAVQAVFMDEVHSVRAVRYAWAEDGTVLLTLDCHVNGNQSPMSFAELKRELSSLCCWQSSSRVVIGLKHALAEVVTLYHAFEYAFGQAQSLMLVCTPPEEYFEAASAFASVPVHS